MNTVTLAPKALIQDARKALESDWSADRLDALQGQVKARVAELAGRVKAITAKDTSTFSNAPGPERQKMVASGDIEALRKLDDEEKDLSAELEILRSLQDKLRQRLDEQRAREYVDGMPKMYAKLATLASAKAKALEVVRKAEQELAATMTEIRNQRHHVTRQKVINGQKLELPGADPELLRTYMAVQGYTYHRGPNRVGWFSPTGGPHDLQNVAEVLGLPVPRPEAAAA